jgi:hypothetical protein
VSWDWAAPVIDGYVIIIGVSLGLGTGQRLYMVRRLCYTDAFSRLDAPVIDCDVTTVQCCKNGVHKHSTCVSVRFRLILCRPSQDLMLNVKRLSQVQAKISL